MSTNVYAAITLVCAWLALVWYTVLKTRHSAPPGRIAQNPDIAVVYATQTGTAKDLAQHTANALGAQRAILLSMAQLCPEQLLGYKNVLFVVSTYGEGDPPDAAAAFCTQMQAWGRDAPQLHNVSVGVLALGDSSYQHYCGFGKTLSAWLEQQGAPFLFDTILADQCDSQALQQWHTQLSTLFQAEVDTDRHYTDWQLTERLLLNPDSVGGACYALTLRPQDGVLPAWRAGDIAEVKIAPYAVHRDYSISSTADEGSVQLLVRQHRTDDGQAGRGSHWLTHELDVGAALQLRLRSNPLFYIPEDARPAIFIGNGTGIAGLRGLLRERAAKGHFENWLIFGERQRERDFFYASELSGKKNKGEIAILDLAFSRDQPKKHYVHDCLRAAAPTLKEWIARGAMVYVCGSKRGMASDVDAAIRDILGPFGYAALLQSQRYRRDIY